MQSSALFIYTLAILFACPSKGYRITVAKKRCQLDPIAQNLFCRQSVVLRQGYKTKVHVGRPLVHMHHSRKNIVFADFGGQKINLKKQNYPLDLPLPRQKLKIKRIVKKGIRKKIRILII